MRALASPSPPEGPGTSWRRAPPTSSCLWPTGFSIPWCGLFSSGICTSALPHRIPTVRVGVIGTVTLVEHQQVFAFGHPVFFSGPTQLPLLASMAAREAMLRAMNRIGPGSASWEWSVTVDDRPDPVRRSDIAFDDTDIGAIVADSVVAFLEQLLDRGLIVRGVDLHAQVEMSPTASA